MVTRRVVLTTFLVLCGGGVWGDTITIVFAVNTSLPLPPTISTPDFLITIQSAQTALFIESSSVQPGYWCDQTTNNCVACPLNTFSNTPDSHIDSCQSCPAYAVASHYASTSCETCASGTFLYTEGITADVSIDPQRQCWGCPSGTYSDANAIECVPVPPGYYAPLQGTTAPVQCPSGTYSSTPGSAECTKCPANTYTYITTYAAGIATYTTIPGGNAAAACVPLPSGQAVCTPGTYFKDVLNLCQPCPVGYYCSNITIAPTPAAIRICPAGVYSPGGALGAATIADCSSNSPAALDVYKDCPLSRDGGAPPLDGYVITAAAAPLLSDQMLFLSTATAVYQFMTPQLALSPSLAGREGEVGSIGGSPGQTRFTHVSALGTDVSSSGPSVLVIGDAGSGSLYCMDLYTRQTRYIGIVGTPSGIAMRVSPNSQRLAYVADSVTHRLYAFDIDSLYAITVAGASTVPAPGYINGDQPGTIALKAPMGIAFLENDAPLNRMLLIADSGNAVIRQLDTQQGIMTTWFAPLDRISPEMITPISVSVVVDARRDAIVYVLDAGFSPHRLSAIGTDSYNNRIITALATSAVAGFGSLFFPSPQLILSTAGYKVPSMLYVSSDGILKSMLDTALSATSVISLGSSQCVYPTQSYNVTTANLCGNLYLDDGEHCDTGGSVVVGCDSACQIESGWQCSDGSTTCLFPCKAYLAPAGTSQAGQMLCSAACVALTPPAGYTIDDKCQLNDVNECDTVTPTNTCSDRAYCVNANGTYTCDCWGTYYGDGRVCATVAYQVYTVVDIPLMQGVSYEAVKAGLQAQLGLAFVDALVAHGSPVDTTFPDMTQYELAKKFVTVKRDVNALSNTRLILSTLFSTQGIATTVAASVNLAELGVALSLAATNGGEPHTDTVVVKQSIEVQQQMAKGFSIPQTMTEWGMNVSNVVFNRTCQAMGTFPANGCWEIDITYFGGDVDMTTGLMGLNTFFVSRVPRNLSDHSLVTGWGVSAAVQSTSSPVYPCQSISSTVSGKLQAAGTACCMRDMANARFHVATGFKAFVDSELYNSAAPEGLCSGGSFNDTFPASNVVSQIPISDGGTNDLVVGGIDGMPMSEVKMVQLVDFVTRTFNVHLTISEDDLLTNAATIFSGDRGVSYAASFFIGMANFKGTGTSALQAHFVVQNVSVSKSNVMTLSTYGANQVTLFL